MGETLQHLNLAWLTVAVCVIAAGLFLVEWARGRRP